MPLGSAFLRCSPVMMSQWLAHGPHSEQQGAGGHPGHHQVSLGGQEKGEDGAFQLRAGGGEDEDEVWEERARPPRGSQCQGHTDPEMGAKHLAAR